ncbi:Serine/threonine-protein kinase SAPK10 [Tetrabaena socialis]|uniref:Serine/threonine-protein kinase SAPK10 n=1 Tax=Tetrabaena socialis TaxID=47790 RepID=A0A2J7ZUS4_9CHLO|nr:Serine/threonine-protein kinase SAPK10 [Tetrabaena socialis]|eukprot:PNH04021.1 Serine/threonine-protein kinase SAPK10 [Tetrabaena socialis]
MLAPPNGPQDPLAEHPQFAKIKDLGLGSFGSVALYKRDESTGPPSLCAIKFMARGPGVDSSLIAREVLAHRVLRHPHVIRFKQLGLTPSHIYLSLEYADQGDLLGFLRRKGPLPEADARWLFQQMIFGLDYCHQKGVVNRDLKPENMLLKLTPEASKRHRRHVQQEREQAQQLWMQLHPGQHPPPPLPSGAVEHRTSNTFNLHIKIADFGLSKKCTAHSLPKTRVGTINYMGPEVLLAGPSQRYDGAKADIWSAGVVLYAMLFSRVPFDVPSEQEEEQAGGGEGRDRSSTIQRILQGDWSVPPGMSVSPQCLDLLTIMLQPDPLRRAPMSAILEHPWFRAGLPPAALTMNTALVRQQEQQGGVGGGPGEQEEAEIEAMLAELEEQAQAEAEAAGAAEGGGGGVGGGGLEFLREDEGVHLRPCACGGNGGGGACGCSAAAAPPGAPYPTGLAGPGADTGAGGGGGADGGGFLARLAGVGLHDVPPLSGRVGRASDFF